MGKIVKSMQLLDKKVRVILSYATGKLRLLGVFRLITGDARLIRIHTWPERILSFYTNLFRCTETR